MLRNCSLLHLCPCIDVNDVHDVLTFCGLQAVNESICLNDEGKYGVKTKADVSTCHEVTSYSAPPKMRIFCTREDKGDREGIPLTHPIP